MHRSAWISRSLALAWLLTLALAGATSAGALSSERTYTSTRYHYSLPIPAGFKLTPASGDLTYGSFPGMPSLAVDYYGKGKAGIGIASVPISSGSTLIQWAHTNIAALANEFGCHAAKSHMTTIGGTAAIELVYPCAGYFDTFEVVHGGRGYDVAWLGPSGNEKHDHALFHKLIADFHFRQ